MIRRFALMVVIVFSGAVHAEEPFAGLFEDTWANWEKRLDRAYKGVQAHHVPDRCVGIIVPNDAREDLLPMSAIGYATLTQDKPRTLIFLLQAPPTYTLNGWAAPAVENIETSIGRFTVDTDLRDLLQNGLRPVSIDPNLFSVDIPRILQTQLAHLKYVLKKNASTVRVLPIYVKFDDSPSQVKDLAPYLAELLKDAGLDKDVSFVIVSNLSHHDSIDKLIRRDDTLLTSLRSQDVDVFFASDPDGVSNPNLDVLTLGLLTLRILASDHADVLAYAHSAQLVLSKDKSSSLSYVTAAFASAPPIKPRQKHVDREKMVATFDELTRSDILALTRQTCLSALDATAAKPPTLTGREAGRKWPAYVTLYNADGAVAGQAGSPTPIGPLEESLGKFALEAVQEARPVLTKANFQNYLVEVSIPYGHLKVNQPEELVPLMTGVVVKHKLKSAAFHPDAWRTYPDPHQLLSSICVRLGLKPWAYATGEADIESFRILSFNEKEPFQDLGATLRKKKKKKPSSDTADDELDSGGSGDSGGTSPFSF